jgi:hypothetical protein
MTPHRRKSVEKEGSCNHFGKAKSLNHIFSPKRAQSSAKIDSKQKIEFFKNPPDDQWSLNHADRMKAADGRANKNLLKKLMFSEIERVAPKRHEFSDLKFIGTLKNRVGMSGKASRKRLGPDLSKERGKIKIKEEVLALG